ncbi:50S ribosomal protein L25/general stress protein Ctc [Aurantimonas sp. C2-6-R+9]|uniref:50S ribosomal protein L25/general stress protein Ctc n=1 Tax=unclassified Aurantimonas TaxID=2638230 RepID=UPI002E189DFC|nr:MULTISPECIES: 50S ribosomal protein L25/general stress protein Ctc [unclassified Aurantimonas]MEC5290069.1 50S ribosomal protein L25/general stress protein Ctc [Aurantimonas sp. C2-3-R2]MEC5381833.1 50S ribosomal protein L25/general stress protein Ctc [Aurantimonas sp. C2-6-R+9]MEC5411134.1 50S ribosomal protein L25/general stress protein Ctc [Aurantimonas sp. C2-4-R8]
MSETFTVKAEARDKVGKGAARHLRRSGMIPAVIYGDKQDPQPIAIPYKETFLALHAGGFMTHVATIELNGKKIQVLPKDYQLEPIRDFLMHVDFLRVSAKTRVTVEIPVHFENEDDAPGLKRGGVLNVVRYTVEVVAPASAIPEAFTLDLTGLEIGASIHASALTLPKGVDLTITDRDFTIATIAAPAALRSEEDEAAAEAEAADEVEATEVADGNAGDDSGEDK